MNTNLSFGGDAAGLGTAVLLILLVVLRVFAPDKIVSQAAYRRSWLYFLMAVLANILVGLVNSTVFGLLAETGTAKLFSLLSFTYLVPTVFWILFYLNLYGSITGQRLRLGSKNREKKE